MQSDGLEAFWANADLPWATLPPKPLADEVARQVLVVRRTWRRNLAGHAFLISCDEAAARKALAEARERASSWGYREEVRLHQTPPSLLGMWRERLLLPWQPITFTQTRNLKSVIFPENPLDSVIRLGEVEHLQVIACQAGWQASEELEMQDMPSHQPSMPPSWLNRQNQIDSQGSRAGSGTVSPWAQDKAYGFLQSDPAWAGCGMQIEAVVHLPALTMHRRLAQAHEGLQALGLLLHPEPMGTMSGQDAGYFRISSRGGLGQSAESLHLAFWKNLKPLLNWEAELREMWWRRDGLLLRDRIRRSLRMLSEAQLLPLHEAIGFVSYVRLGALLGEIESEWLIPAEKVRVLLQSAHLGFASPPMPDADKAEWQKRLDARRAEKVRTLWKLPRQ